MRQSVREGDRQGIRLSLRRETLSPGWVVAGHYHEPGALAHRVSRSRKCPGGGLHRPFGPGRLGKPPTCTALRNLVNSVLVNISVEPFGCVVKRIRLNQLETDVGSAVVDSRGSHHRTISQRHRQFTCAPLFPAKNRSESVSRRNGGICSQSDPRPTASRSCREIGTGKNDLLIRSQ